MKHTKHNNIGRGVTVLLALILIGLCILLATPAHAYDGTRVTTARQEALHEAADILRGCGYADDSEVIRAIQAEWRAEQERKALIKSLPRWIPVTERMPEDNHAVNVVWINHSPVFYYQSIKDRPQVATAVLYRGKWYWWSAVVQDYLAEYGEWDCDKMDEAIEVTHWMPLPEPPKEET